MFQNSQPEFRFQAPDFAWNSGPTTTKRGLRGDPEELTGSGQQAPRVPPKSLFGRVVHHLNLRPSSRNTHQLPPPRTRVSNLASAARVLAAQGARHLAVVPAFQPLPVSPTQPEPEPLFAIDGSHAVLVDNGATWVVAHRAIALPWPSPAGQPVLATKPVVTATTPDQAAHLAGESVATAEAFAQALRVQAEQRALLDAIRAAPRSGLVLADGALRGLPPAPQALADEARELARSRGVALVGISKRSGLERDGVPLVAALHAAGPAHPWVSTVQEGVHVARLHAAAPFAFRVDADQVDDVGRLLPLCRDAAYIGYPYPLAKAHNRVAFTAGEVAELKAGLERALRRQGASAVLAARDFHDVLDRNVPG